MSVCKNYVRQDFLDGWTERTAIFRKGLHWPRERVVGYLDGGYDTQTPSMKIKPPNCPPSKRTTIGETLVCRCVFSLLRKAT